jgi:hypothetical protein
LGIILCKTGRCQQHQRQQKDDRKPLFHYASPKEILTARLL